MWDEVGILRTADGLRRGLAGLAELRAELHRTGLADGDRAFNLTWHDWINLESQLAVSEVIAVAALAREDSRGAHFREDFPETGDLDTTAFTRVTLDEIGTASCREGVCQYVYLSWTSVSLKKQYYNNIAYIATTTNKIQTIL